MKTAKGTIEHNSWDEKPYHEAASLKSSEARIDIVMHGDIEASGPCRYLMQYPTAETCHYAGYLTLTGSIAGKSGSFVIFETGLWSDGTVNSRWQIVENSGTGELAGLSGQGRYAAQHDKTVHYELEYEQK